MEELSKPSSWREPKSNGKASDFLVVGIGASAGGIDALSEFFSNVPADSGIAFVVILHLSPDHDSRLADVLQVASGIPVEQVTEPTRIEPDHVYVVPPNRRLEVKDGQIIVNPFVGAEERRAPVDIFFRTLADAMGPRAVAVVLSGTGANGSMGLKRVKEVGGVAFVQNPREAEFNDMPRNAIATELVDAILPVAEIPKQILQYRNTMNAVSIPVESKDRADRQQQALREIFSMLRIRTGHDFSNYKRATVLRRIERRMGVKNLPDLQQYASHLREDPEEPLALLKDLLISVTNFYRDQAAFNALETDVFPRILENRNPQDPVRIWVAGCATGEEAYSLAIIAAEQIAYLSEPPPVQLFATDIDEHAIAFAREGLYTLNDVADVSPERLRKFFTKEGDSYRIRREVRETILFANNNVLKDPPFSRLDMVSCRNLLIYLNRPAQERVLETFHFALKPGGYLFIGSSESIDGSGDLFVPVSKENHIFQSRQAGARPLPVPESVPLLRPLVPRDEPVRNNREKLERITYNELHLRLLEEFAPPSLVVDENYDIVHLSKSAGKYLQMAGGEPTNNLLRLIRPDMRLEVRSALFQARQQRTNVEAKNVQVRLGERTETVNILIRPVMEETDTARGYILIVFAPAADTEERSKPVYARPEPMAQKLEEELIHSKSRLQAALEQAEVQSEELRASNEELQAMNEELRSSTEELETSKEELQSINEELTTVNLELKVKIEELSQANNNFQNLLNSIDVGTIFLDRSLRVKLFSPAARELFNLIANDTGRPLSDITSDVDHEDLETDAEHVLTTLQTVEREIKTNDGRFYLMRIVPYRTTEDWINGVVVTFTNVTRIKTAEEELRKAHVDLEMKVRNRTSRLTELATSLQEEVEERKIAETNVRELLRRLVDIQEEERKRIARDIHDQMGQELTALRIHLESLRTAGTAEDLNEQISKALKCAQDLDRSVDFLTWELRPASLDHLGLAPALDELVKSWSDRFGIQAEFHQTATEALRLSPEAETNLYLFAREALHNVYKHAEAKNVGVVFEKRDSQVVLIIEDDGKGFDPDSVTPSLGHGLGLVSMRERARLIGADVEIESKPGNGTTVYVRLPLDETEPPAGG